MPTVSPSRIPVKLKYLIVDEHGKTYKATNLSEVNRMKKVLKNQGVAFKVTKLPKGHTTWNTNPPGIYVPPIKSRSTARAPHPHGGKPNPKRGTTVPAHVRINPRNGRIQVFVTPKVAEKLRGGKGLRVAGNPNEPVYSVGTTQIPYAAHGLTQKQAVTYLKKYPMDSLGFWNSIYKKQPDGSYKKINVKKKR